MKTWATLPNDRKNETPMQDTTVIMLFTLDETTKQYYFYQRKCKSLGIRFYKNKQTTTNATV